MLPPAVEPYALTRLRDQRLLAVIRAPSPEAALSASEAVARGGITMLEITFTVPEATRVMAELSNKPQLCIGAGTVLSGAQARSALEAGAKFIVAPNFSPEVAQVALEAGVLYMPGAYTTSEIIGAHALGAHVVKVYPAGVGGGPRYIEIIRDPLPNIPMLAAGGTNLDNTIPFLRAGCIGVGLGGALVDPKLVEAGQLLEITHRASSFLIRLREHDALRAAQSGR